MIVYSIIDLTNGESKIISVNSPDHDSAWGAFQDYLYEKRCTEGDFKSYALRWECEEI